MRTLYRQQMIAALTLLTVAGCNGPELEPAPVDTDAVDTDDSVVTDGDTDTVEDTDTTSTPAGPSSYIRYVWTISDYPNGNTVEAYCDGKLVYAESEFLLPSGVYEVRLEVEPGTECYLTLYDETGASLPPGEWYVCDLLQGVWVEQTGFGPVQVGTAEAETCEPGCMDELAENFNPVATTDDGTCEYIEGCTDHRAQNYDPVATLDDGSCEFDGFAEIFLQIKTDLFPTETTVEVECDGYDVFYKNDYSASNSWHEHTMIIDEGWECILRLSDSYGDAGAAGDISMCGQLLYEWTSFNEPGSSSWQTDLLTFFVQGCSGCTDSTSANYDPAAYIDDGSCK